MLIMDDPIVEYTEEQKRGIRECHQRLVEYYLKREDVVLLGRCLPWRDVDILERSRKENADKSSK